MIIFFLLNSFMKILLPAFSFLFELVLVDRYCLTLKVT